MKKYLLFIIFLLLFNDCSKDSTSSPSIDYYTDDQQFINDLATANDISEVEIINDRIITVEVDSGGVTFYKIRKLYLSNFGLDSLPLSIGKLDSLNILLLNNNKLQHITESICTIYDQLDSLDLNNNDICNDTFCNRFHISNR